MKKVALLCIAVAFAAGCAAPVPFRDIEGGAPGDADPRTVVEVFEKRIPVSFQLLNSIVFEYNFLLSFPGIGFIDVDRKEGTYKVACMNQMGVKFFDFEGNRRGLISQYVIGPLAERGDVAKAVGTDIQRIYFDLFPAADARVIRRKTELVFRQRSDDGALEYAFIGGKLASKTYREDHRAVWRVSYYEYTEKDGKLYPLGIIFTNYRYGYRLIVRQKEIRG